MAANIVSETPPIYTALALKARIQGTVSFSALIGREGHVEEMNVISGHPLLVQAAYDAVIQWVYKPTLLNGLPVEILTTVSVNFTIH